MCPEDFEPFDLAEIYARKEPLLPELSARLEDMGGFIALRHPLLYTVPYFPAMAALANAQFGARQKMLQAARDEGLELNPENRVKPAHRLEAVGYARDDSLLHW